MTEAELKGMVNEFGEEAKNEIGRKEFVSMVKDVRRRRKSVMTEGLPGQGVSLDDVALVQSGDDSEEAEGGIMIWERLNIGQDLLFLDDARGLTSLLMFSVALQRLVGAVAN